MNKRIYLIIIYIITALCIIAGILGNIFNAAPFNRLTASSSGNNCDFYEEFNRRLAEARRMIGVA